MKTTAAIAPPTTNKHLIRWVEKMADLCQPDSIHWIDGSKAEYDYLCEQLITAGTFTRLNQKPWRQALQHGRGRYRRPASR